MSKEQLRQMLDSMDDDFCYEEDSDIDSPEIDQYDGLLAALDSAPVTPMYA